MATSNRQYSPEDVINPKYTNEQRPQDFVQIDLIREGMDPQVRYVHESQLQSWIEAGWKKGKGDGSVTWSDGTTMNQTASAPTPAPKVPGQRAQAARKKNKP